MTSNRQAKLSQEKKALTPESFWSDHTSFTPNDFQKLFNTFKASCLNVFNRTGYPAGIQDMYNYFLLVQVGISSHFRVLHDDLFRSDMIRDLNRNEAYERFSKENHPEYEFSIHIDETHFRIESADIVGMRFNVGVIVHVKNIKDGITRVYRITA